MEFSILRTLLEDIKHSQSIIHVFLPKFELQKCSAFYGLAKNLYSTCEPWKANIFLPLKVTLINNNFQNQINHIK